MDNAWEPIPAGRLELQSQSHPHDENLDYSGLIISGRSVGNVSYDTSVISIGSNLGSSQIGDVVTTVVDNSMPGSVSMTSFSTSTSVSYYEAMGLKDILPELIIGTGSLGLVVASLAISAISDNQSATIVSLGLAVAFAIGLVGSVLTARKR